LSIKQGGTHSLLFDKAVIHSIFNEITAELTTPTVAATAATVTMVTTVTTRGSVLATTDDRKGQQNVSTTSSDISKGRQYVTTSTGSRRCSLQNRDSTVHYVDYSDLATCNATANVTQPNTRRSSVAHTLTCLTTQHSNTANEQSDTTSHTCNRRSSVSSDNSSTGHHMPYMTPIGMLSPRYVYIHVYMICVYIMLHNTMSTVYDRYDVCTLSTAYIVQ
jgi:hypothetical protein